MVHSHLRWSFVWQRPQQIHSRLARRHPILFVEEPVWDDASGRDRLDVTTRMPNLWVAQPRLAPGRDVERRTEQVIAEAARGVLRKHFSGALHWVYTPMMESHVDLFPEPAAIVYDCMDELSKFAEAPPRLLEKEARLLGRADVVFAGGYELGAAKAKRHPNVHVFGCGVDFEHFRRAATMPEADELAMIPRPRIGYYGVIDERLDYDLLRALARFRPDWTIVMVGPVAKVDPASLPKESNIVYLGPKDYADLPAYAAGFDACLMPFAMNEASYYINPTKTLEYLATGRPVVSTPVRDVVRQFSSVVSVANAAAFPAAVALALEGGGPARELGVEVARQNSWDKTVARMELFAAVALLRRRDRRSAGRAGMGALEERASA